MPSLADSTRDDISSPLKKENKFKAGTVIFLFSMVLSISSYLRFDCPFSLNLRYWLSLKYGNDFDLILKKSNHSALLWF